MSVADIFMPSVASLNAGAMGIILAFLALEYSLINEKVFVALVITAIVTSMMSGPLIQWAMGGRALFAKKALAKNDRGFEREGIAE